MKMVKVIFVDEEYQEIEIVCLDLTIEEALKILPNLDFRVGEDRLQCDKTGVIIVDIKNEEIEIQLNYGDD